MTEGLFPLEDHLGEVRGLHSFGVLCDSGVVLVADSDPEIHRESEDDRDVDGGLVEDSVVVDVVECRLVCDVRDQFSPLLDIALVVERELCADCVRM